MLKHCTVLCNTHRQDRTVLVRQPKHRFDSDDLEVNIGALFLLQTNPPGMHAYSTVLDDVTLHCRKTLTRCNLFLSYIDGVFCGAD